MVLTLHPPFPRGAYISTVTTINILKNKGNQLYVGELELVH